MKALVSLLTVGLLAVGAGCAHPKPPTARQQAEQQWNQVRARVKLQLAEQQSAAGQFEHVVATAGEAITLDPTCARAYIVRAEGQLELGNPSAAQQTIQLAEQAGIRAAELAYLLGVIAEQCRDLPGALQRYHEARTLAEDKDVDFIAAEAECLVALERPVEALTLVDEHAVRFPGDATLTVLGAHIAALLGDAEGAARRYRDALPLVKDGTLVPEEYGLLLVSAGRWAEAAAMLEPLLRTLGENASPVVRRALALCQLEAGDPEAALRTLREYARNAPEDTRAQILLAKSAVATGDLALARRSLEIARQREPRHPEVLLVRAVIQWRCADHTGAADSLRQLLQQRPDDVDAYCLLAEVCSAQGAAEDARNYFSEALRRNPHCTWAQAGLQAVAADGPGPIPAPVTATP
ncbi:MAG TPA: tetratricopeptide repeat protein [Phycisphaerae bacterium]|nr:tetratricopeptide repeat protein [Phycisphaerae bacterium]HNU46639.1 tetratricopeptide repeat protein [Phycisphaerae bacterium]